MALVGLVDQNETLTPAERPINDLRPFAEGEIRAKARIVPRGSRTAIGEAEVRNARGDLVAKGPATDRILQRRPPDQPAASGA